MKEQMVNIDEKCNKISKNTLDLTAVLPNVKNEKERTVNRRN